MNSSLVLFMNSMILGVMVSLCSNNLISIWIGLEVSLMSFLPIMVSESILSSESSMKYFIVQGLSSSMLLLGVMILISDLDSMSNLIISISLMIKLGVAPFHMWVLSVVEGLNYVCLFILLFFMKLVPLYILSLMNFSLLILSILTMIVGSISGMVQNSIRKLLALSSVYNLGLLISCIYEISIWLIYFFIYGLILISLLMLTSKINSNYLNQIIMFEFDLSKKLLFWLVMLSMGGLPPFLGFFNKIIVIEFLISNGLFMNALVLIFTALVVIYFYIRMTYISLMFFSLTLKLNLTKVSQMSLLVLSINLMMFPLIIVYNSLT